jgi:hypothetical protein
MRTTNYTRKDVAEWAKYCMGSCYGDLSPETKAMYGEVMSNDETFEFYRKTFIKDHRTHDRQRDEQE